MWYRDRKWANSVGKMTSIDFKSRIASNLQLVKKKKKGQSMCKPQQGKRQKQGILIIISSILTLKS